MSPLSFISTVRPCSGVLGAILMSRPGFFGRDEQAEISRDDSYVNHLSYYSLRFVWLEGRCQRFSVGYYSCISSYLFRPWFMSRRDAWCAEESGIVEKSENVSFAVREWRFDMEQSSPYTFLEFQFLLSYKYVLLKGIQCLLCLHFSNYRTSNDKCCIRSDRKRTERQ